jgi:hypothetical protein
MKRGAKTPQIMYSVTIRGTFGSDVQREIAKMTLSELVVAWKREIELRHKKNKVTIAEE